MARDLSIVLNNGRLNGAVVTAMAAQKFRPILVNFENPSQPGGRARAAYEQQLAHFKPYREHTFPIAFTGATRAQNQPIADPRQPAPMAPQLLELLPMVAVAVRLAAHYQAAAVYLGLRIGPGSDELAQATEFFQIWNEMAQLPCAQTDLEILTPLLELEPWQVVEVAYQVAAPLDRTWSCQDDSNDPCWACKSCRARESAFQQAGKPDPMRPVKR